MIAELVLLVVTLYLLYKYIQPKVPANFPPGPTNYPIVGGAYVIPKLDPEFGVALIKLGEKYGPVTGLHLGDQLCLVVNGYDAIKDILSREEFNGRPVLFDKFLESIEGGIREKGIMFSVTEIWQEQRRFTLRVLRDLGFGKTSLEGIIHDEIRETIDILERKMKESLSKDCDGIPIQTAFAVGVVNVLWHVVAGKRFKHDDQECLDRLQKLQDAFRTPNPLSNIVFTYPWLKYLPVFSGIYQNMDTIAECQRTPSNDVDFIREYLKEVENMKGKGNEKTSFTTERLIAVCTDLFSAGAESTSNQVAYAMLYMLHYPEVQRKVHEELDRVVSKDQLPSMDDKSKLVYTEAVLNELFRRTTVAPITVPHSVLSDTKLYGYDIPKDTMVQLNLHSINMDKSYWGDPENFRPERFIGPDGKLIKHDRLIPFGNGKRICPGESLARMNLFLFFTSLMQAFQILPVPGQPKPTLIPVTGFTVAPAPFNAILISRK